MPDVTRRRTGELLRKLFESLMAHPDGMKAKDCLSALVSNSTMTEYESGFYANGARRFEKIVRFATVDAVKAGWSVKANGVWTVTDLGRTAVAKYKDPEAFYQEANRLYRQWKAMQPAKPDDGKDAADDAEDQETVGEREVSTTFEEAKENAWQDIEKYLMEMNPYDLQHLVAGLLRAMSYHVAWVSPPGKDGGIDILAYSDPLGARPPRVKVQVKRLLQTASVEGIRSFISQIGDDDVGIFVNMGGFTKEAETTARTQEKRKVTLVDLRKFVEMWVEHYSDLEDAARRRLPLRPIYFLAPLD